MKIIKNIGKLIGSLVKFVIGIPTNFIKFIKSVLQELKLVEWISMGETVKLTFGVITISGLIALSIAVSDKLFNVLITNFL